MRKRKSILWPLTSRRGVTLVEVLIAVFILTVGISGVLVLFVNAAVSSQLAWDVTVASTNAEYILEEMYAMPERGQIVNRDWDQWAADQGIKQLPKEKFELAFPSSEDGLLDVVLTVHWEKRNRPQEWTVFTKLLK